MAGHVIVGGGTGFIGTHFINLLKSKNYNVTVISRMPGIQRISWKTLSSEGLPKDVTAVVNLSGQNVLDPTRRWTAGFKQNVYNSRINTNQMLVNAITKSEQKPKVFVTISGVGIYEPSLTKNYDEESSVNEFDFLSKLVLDWEAAGNLPETCSNVRRVTIRSGVVLGRNGGMIKNLYIPFYLGLGGPIGQGTQFLPWIHIDDMTNLLLFALQNEKTRGIINGVAPELVTNEQFTKAFGSALWRPTFFRVPESALNLLFSAERAKIMLEGQRVQPKRALELGFQYKYPSIKEACVSLAAGH